MPAESMSSPGRQIPPASHAVAAIIRRDLYRRARGRYVNTVLVGSVVLLGLSLFGLHAVNGVPRADYLYLPVQSDARLVEFVPMDQPKHPDEFVVRWAVEAVTRLFTFDHVNFRAQLQDAKLTMTPAGWTGFEKALVSSNAFRDILEFRYVATAAPLSEGRIDRKAVSGGRYAWRIQFPMLVRYQAQGANPTPQEVKVTVVVVRTTEALNPRGLAVSSIIAE
jgi:hypothetical protein